MRVRLQHNEGVWRLSLVALFIILFLAVFSSPSLLRAEAAAKLVINEISTKESQWIELYNPTDQTIDMSGWFITRASDNTNIHQPLAEGTLLKPQSYFVINLKDNQLSDDGMLILHDAEPNTAALHELSYAMQDAPSFGLGKDGQVDRAKELEVSTKGTSNNLRCQSLSAEKCVTPVAPSLTSPEHNGISNSPLVYDWSSVKDADSYIFESYDDAELTVTHTSKQLASTNFIQYEPHDAHIWWRVRAVSEGGRVGSWSEVRNVVVDNKAPVLGNATKGDMSAVRGLVTFQVESADDNHDKIVITLDGAHYKAEQADSQPMLLTATQHVVTRMNLDTTTISDGPHQLAVYAIDEAGNRSNTVVIDFVVKNTNLPKEQSLPTANETVPPIPMPHSPTIRTLIGGNLAVEPKPANEVEVAVLGEQSGQHTLQQAAPRQHVTRQSQTVKPSIYSWPVWLGAGMAISGVGWWVWSGRRHSL